MIIGIEMDKMPTDCYECPLQIKFKDGVQDDWYMRRCVVKNRVIEYPRPEWCPLKEQETELEQKLKEQEDAYSELAKEYLSLSNRAAHKPNIVRCKDCKHGSLYCTEDVCGETLIECNRPDLGDVIEIHGWKWFCADGVAKDINVPDKESR